MEPDREAKGKSGYMPIGYKLMLSYMIFVVALVSVNGYISHRMYESSMRQQTQANIGAALLQIRDNVAYKTSDMVRISNTLYDDHQLLQSAKLRLDDFSMESFQRMDNVIFPKLDSAIKSIGIHLILYAYFDNESVKERYWSISDERMPAYAESRYNVYHLKRIRVRDWYLTLPEERYGETIVWKQVDDDAEKGRISMIRRMVDTGNPFNIQELGVMRFSVRLSDVFESADHMKLGEGSMLTISGPSGELVYQSGDKADSGDGKFLTIVETMGSPEWSFEAHIPLTIVEREAVRIRNYILAVCALCVILFSFAGLFISRYFGVRIVKFVSVLNAFREGDWHKRISYKGKDEMSQIATALNRMGEDMESMIDKVYLTQLQKKEAELEMLQTQINPHFLYNTLSSINQLAKFGQNEKLQQMVVELAKFYRLTLNSGRTLIPVYAELEQSMAYVAIQKVKYGHRLDVTYDIDSGIWPYETLKLLLQPFIENALKHAWRGDRIHIRVVARLAGDNILYRIIDDGIGAKPERFREVMNSDGQNENGFGIRNIHERINLHYGPGYGVSIFSSPGIGTAVQITIPAKKRKLFIQSG